jgi:hypothetical protein
MLRVPHGQGKTAQRKKKATYDFRLRKVVIDIHKDALKALRRTREIIVDVLKEQLPVDDKDVIVTNN